ncbi:MAG: polyprenyl synthetase family protein, partial [Acidobacteriota bacterium]|nr:polyprenyl synthetase family protein [Acidobacteriota bacterium]
MNLPEYLREQQTLIDTELDRLVPPETQFPETIHKAMRYSLFAGGKRIRPILCLEAARAVRAAVDGVEAAACSLEFIHTYSLIHDDLPPLDNDDYRRGKLTCHKVFGEAMAILAGDALLTLAFQTLAQLPGVAGDARASMIAELAVSAGTVGGMIGGQVADLEGEGKPPDAQLLDSIHRAKTGALLRASVRI